MALATVIVLSNGHGAGSDIKRVVFTHRLAKPREEILHQCGDFFRVPGAPGRARIVPPPDDAEETARPCAQKHSSADPLVPKAASSTQTNLATTKSVNERYYTWAELMRRVFAFDVLECPRCQGPMKILAPIHPPDTTRKILQCLGLPARPPPIAMARPDPQESLPFDCDEAARLD